MGAKATESGTLTISYLLEVIRDKALETCLRIYAAEATAHYFLYQLLSESSGHSLSQDKLTRLVKNPE